MPTPKSVVKIKKDGIEYVSNVDAGQYYMYELSRAALRDVGKFICRKFKESYYSKFKKHTGEGGKSLKFQVLSGKSTTHPRVEIGIPRIWKGKKIVGFYAAFQEFGTSKQSALGLIRKAAEDNIQTIIEIESKYLSALEDEARALQLVQEGDMAGGEDE